MSPQLETQQPLFIKMQNNKLQLGIKAEYTGRNKPIVLAEAWKGNHPNGPSAFLFDSHGHIIGGYHTPKDKGQAFITDKTETIRATLTEKGRNQFKFELFDSEGSPSGAPIALKTPGRPSLQGTFNDPLVNMKYPSPFAGSVQGYDLSATFENQDDSSWELELSVSTFGFAEPSLHLRSADKEKWVSVGMSFGGPQIYLHQSEAGVEMMSSSRVEFWKGMGEIKIQAGGSKGAERFYNTKLRR